MRAHICAIAAIIACSSTGPAEAAPPTPWTGIYFGANGGYFPSDIVVESDVFPRFSQPQKGPAVGVQAGYNHQWGSLVVGIEADLSYLSLRGDVSNSDFVPFGSVRPRLGLDLNGYLMPYTTVGVSYMRVTFDGGTSAGLGYVWGGGVAARLGNNWSLFGEYLQGEQDIYQVRVPGFTLAKSQLKTDLVRAGLNFHPGAPNASSGTAHTSFDWTGFYVGANGGYAFGDHTSEIYPVDQKIDIRGGALGVQAGYNHQIGKAVIGLETDFSYLAAKGHGDFVETRIDKLGTLRARLGYDINGLLPYLSGGIAYGTDRTEIISRFDGASFGYVFGGGAAMRLNSQWSAHLEAMHVRLEDGPFDNLTSATIVRAGLNYHAP